MLCDDNTDTAGMQLTCECMQQNERQGEMNED